MKTETLEEKRTPVRQAGRPENNTFSHAIHRTMHLRL